MADDVVELWNRTRSGIWMKSGFSAHGFHLGSATGATMAELTVTAATNMPIAAFHISRFASK